MAVSQVHRIEVWLLYVILLFPSSQHLFLFEDPVDLGGALLPGDHHCHQLPRPTHTQSSFPFSLLWCLSFLFLGCISSLLKSNYVVPSQEFLSHAFQKDKVLWVFVFVAIRWFTTQMSVNTESRRAWSWDPVPQLGLPCGWQKPRNLSHHRCPQGLHQQEPEQGLELRHPGVEPGCLEQ